MATEAGASAPPTAMPVSSLSAADVVAAYRILLARDPENADIVASHLARHRSMSTLRASILRSAEFAAKSAGLASVVLPAQLEVKPLDWPAIRVDAEVTPEQLTELICLVEGNWELLGQTDPHWSVVTNEKFKSVNIEKTEEDFYKSGEGSVKYMLAAAARSHRDVSNMNTCLELGCGVGRATIWLANHFRSVVGVDISRPHIALAEDAAQKRNITNVKFFHINSINGLKDLPEFDFLFSVIVLQHNPPPVIYAMLDVLLAKLNPGGVAYFQVPTYGLDRAFDVAAYLASAAVRGRMEVHVLPQHVVFALLARHGCQVLEVREDGWIGSPRMVSNSFLVQKL